MWKAAYVNSIILLVCLPVCQSVCLFNTRNNEKHFSVLVKQLHDMTRRNNCVIGLDGVGSLLQSAGSKQYQKIGIEDERKEGI